MASSLHFSSISAAGVRLRSSTASISSFALKLPSLRLRRRRRGGAVMIDTAAASYANALADVAKANNTLDSTMNDMEKLSLAFADPQVRSFFVNPVISADKKELVAREISASAGVQPHTANFLSIIIDMNRSDIIDDIVKEFESCYNKITGTEVAVVASVLPLESQQLAQIAQVVQRLTGAKNVRIKTVIEPSLVAGFTIRYGASGSKLIDMSVKKQLDEISAQLDFSNISLV